MSDELICVDPDPTPPYGIDREACTPVDRLFFDLADIRDGLAPVDLADTTLDGLAQDWLTLLDLHRQLGVICDELALIVGDKLSDQDYDPKEGYVLPSGDRVHHMQRSSEKWAGRQLLHDLASEVIDGNGERVRAIPVDVLEQIVPGTATENLTSSSWRTTGLKNLDVNPDDYRTREWKPVRAAKGTRR